MSNNIETLIDFEDQLLVKHLQKMRSDSNRFTKNELNKIFKYVHLNLINSLINCYMQYFCKGYDESLFYKIFGCNFENIIHLPEIRIDNIPLICEYLHISFLNSNFVYSNGKFLRKKSKSNLLESGAVYTNESIAYDIVYRTLKNIYAKRPSSIKILDFATGTGRFYRQIVKCLFDLYGINPDYSIINNIYAIDIDQIAVNICRINAFSLLSDFDINKAMKVSKHIINKNALIRQNLIDSSFAPVEEDFINLYNISFDAIVSNPPYLVLKPNKNKMDIDTIENINRMIKYFRNSGDYIYSIEGMLNLYQLSIEAMLNMLKKGGEMGVICPSTLFADISASRLRKFILAKHEVSYIKYFPEDITLFENVTQATSIFHLTNEGRSNIINIENGSKKFNISLDDIKTIFNSNWEIPSIEKIEWNILNKLQRIHPLKSHSYIRNKRGELDLTLYKKYITKEKTQHRLVRGNMISNNGIIDVNHEYVLSDFFNNKSENYLLYDKGKRRLVCQQISNMTQKVRLNFVECEITDVLGNSCNYITVREDLINQLNVLLNSALLNWRFKITSTNNHINNYELDELPIIDLKLITDDIIKMDKKNRDMEICKLYGLSVNEINFIIKQQYDII